MRFHWTSSKMRWKDSFTVSLAVLATIQAITEVTGLIELKPIEALPWWIKLLLVFILFSILTIIVFVAKLLISRKGIKLTIENNEVRIKQADIFQQDGLRLIPFNEYFDTQVDDVIIAHETLNGKFIDDYVDDINALQNVICDANKNNGIASQQPNGKNKFPLGCIVKFKEYLLLAFTHFNNKNVAYLSHTDFEKCLIAMWLEIRRVYANKPIFIPLLGSGITNFTDTPHKDNFSLAKCLLCTLKMSGVHLKQPITICLTKDTLNEINLYELKSK